MIYKWEMGWLWVWLRTIVNTIMFCVLYIVKVLYIEWNKNENYKTWVFLKSLDHAYRFLHPKTCTIKRLEKALFLW